MKWRTYRPSDREKIDETPLCAARNRLNGYACAFATATICTSECIGARRRDDEAPAGFELARAEGQKRFPVLDSLALPCGALRASVELFCAPIDGYRNATSREWGGG